jgi:hypothetical protein
MICSNICINYYLMYSNVNANIKHIQVVSTTSNVFCLILLPTTLLCSKGDQDKLIV